MNNRVSLATAVAVVLMLGSVGASMALKPTERIADIKPKMVLAELIPTQFDDWQLLPSITPVLPDPSVQAMLDSLYSQTVARTYINSKGQIIMLTIAYGSDQKSDATAAHRPEFCYTGGGFTVTTLGTRVMDINGTALTVRELLANREQQHEKVAYWVTLDEKATLPGLGRKLAQMRYGLQGQIADGMLVRLSSIEETEEDARALQEKFLRELSAKIPPQFRSRIFGA